MRTHPHFFMLAVVFALLATACGGERASSPPPAETTAQPDPGSDPASEPRADPRDAPPPSRVVAPASLEAMMEAHDLTSAPFSEWQRHIAPLVGTAVRWPLRSWGGELTRGTFDTPEGPQGTARVRLISRSLGEDADLLVVYDSGHPIVACLADFSGDAERRFVRSDGAVAPTPGRQEVILEAVIWGVTGEGNATLWLRDCRVASFQ
ncbi:MAG: hypothetical protein AB8I08_39635 [Sandaracinaceae bacterium]